MLQNILWGFIVIIVGVELAPIVASTVQTATNGSSGFSTADISLLKLVTTFFVIAILSVGVTMVSVSFRNAGLA